MYHYAIRLLEKKPENIILHLGINNAPYKSDTDILKDLIELKDFILEKSPSCKKITLSTPAVRTDRENAKKNNENLTNRLKKQGIPYITHDNITHKHLYRDGLHLNWVGFPFSLKIFCLVFGEIDFRLKLKTKGKKMKLIPQKRQKKTAMI